MVLGQQSLLLMKRIIYSTIIEIHPHLFRNGFLKILQDPLSMMNISAGVADLTAALLPHCTPTSFNG